MLQSLKNKRAIVTGASKGIGLAIAHSLYAEGANVVLCGRQQQSLNAAVQQMTQTPGGQAWGVVADVSQINDVERLFETAKNHLRGLDILVNNAGMGVFHPTAELSIADWDKLIATNLSGAFYCSKHAIQQFQQGNGGHIINISSLAGKNAFAGGAAYNASKFGLNGFSEAMMLDHRSDKVKVSYIMPGSVDTEFAGKSVKEKSTWKIASEDVAEIVIGVLKLPERTLISRVEVRPSVPKKD